MPGDASAGPRDVRIVFTGSRPGEKIHEELWGGDESVGETEHPKIKRLSRPPVDSAWLTEQLLELEQLAEDGDTLEVVGKLGAIVRRPVRESLPATGPAAARPRTEASPRTADEPSPSA